MEALALWAKIAQKATTQNATFIELALSWAKDENGQERDLHRQPWEMMHNGTEFLARVFPHLVTVTRLVAGNALEPRQLGLPPRVLFVIGSKIDDPQIRPGAEYLGLLRQIRSENGARSIHTRIFCTSADRPERKITPSSLRTVVKDFQPDVVHFICHGGFDSAQRRGYLELEAEPGETDKKRYADKLLECLHAGERPPVIVVLSACYSAVAAAQPNAQPEPPTLLRAEHAAPLAAELVAGGIPIVIGMAGRVADRACRLFTRRLGTALVDGAPLARAAAQGRLAAFVDRPNLDKSVDWAFPTVFLHEKVPSEFRPVNVTNPNTIWEQERRIRAYNLLRSPPVFCGREAFFEDYYDLFGPASRPVLVIYTNADTRGIGRQRLLHELLGQAIRDGHVPCVVRAEGDQDPLVQFPRNATQFALRLLKAINGARAVCQLDVPLDSTLLTELESAGQLPLLAQWRQDLARNPQLFFARVFRHCQNLPGNVLGADQIKVVLHAELGRLRDDARRQAREALERTNDSVEKDSLARRCKGQVVVFLEQVDQYGDVLRVLLEQILKDADAAGLGPSNDPVPVVMTFTRAGPAAALWDLIAEAGRSFLTHQELKPFAKETGEEALACERVLMYPFPETAGLLPQVSDTAWAFNAQAASGIVSAWQRVFSRYVGGLPEKFTEKGFYEVAQDAVDGQYLLPAPDERIFEDIVKGNLVPGERYP